MPRSALALAALAALMGAAGVALAALTTHRDGGEFWPARLGVPHPARRCACRRFRPRLARAARAGVRRRRACAGDAGVRGRPYDARLRRRANVSIRGAGGRLTDDRLMDRAGSRVCGRVETQKLNNLASAAGRVSPRGPPELRGPGGRRAPQAGRPAANPKIRVAAAS